MPSHVQMPCRHEKCLINQNVECEMKQTPSHEARNKLEFGNGLEPAKWASNFYNWHDAIRIHQSNVCVCTAHTGNCKLFVFVMV